ncbi:asparagine synthase-related protein [Planococcus shenhongbingii]|uniref:asparagine synthase-related protein n=1 Tax=Planococcus shenhongbingii TaxID=3058398 RepID=UPI00260BF8CE|nr:asparagine synthase-related protein [Planococcus sp. N016]WKA57756.1 asparagine synthase-related protein [Planococcus sp. N016]
MSDFIYSNQMTEAGVLKKEIHLIYHEDFPEVKEYHGNWGSLAVSRNLYNGFNEYEDSDYLCVVIGGPVLYFRDNLFLNEDPSTEGTKAIFNRWKKGEMCWDEDLSGPFNILIINKKTSEIFCITDIMSFIPVFVYQNTSTLMLSTHSDALARAANQHLNVDVVAKVDFILSGVVTYPYTVYQHLFQIAPASIHFKKPATTLLKSESYWIPAECSNKLSIDKAAEDLREALEVYVAKVTKGMPNIAQFISGGEDSRLLSGLLPNQSKREAFIYLNSMNREGIRAKKTADAYGVQFNLFTREKTHYLEILPAAADMIGDGAEYIHAHTLKFYKKSNLLKFRAVFGGFYSDSLLKGDCIVKPKVIGRLPFMPQMKRRNHSRGDQIISSVFSKQILQEVAKRRTEHLNFVRSFREKTAEEWFELWPSSMNYAIPNLHVNRRLFRSYEPFMANHVVKISAMASQKWMLNRRLFHKTAKPYFKKTKWLFHSDGRLPYFPWYINSFIQFWVWGYQQISTKIGLVKEYQGPWGEWDLLFESEEVKKYIEKYSNGSIVMDDVFIMKDLNKVFKSNELTVTQKINLLQTLYSNQKISELVEEDLVKEDMKLTSIMSLK